MNILITGSHGYVGSNFINAYKHKHIFSTFSLQKHSLNELHIENIDTVLHCAALVHKKDKFNHEQYYEINTIYPIELAKKAKKYGVKQFIFLSSIAVYGSTLTCIDENSECVPDTPYGKSKLVAEKGLKEVEDENFTVSIVRFPMVYGKNAPGNIKNLIRIIQKMPILPFKDIDNKRSFIYIDNLLGMLQQIVILKKGGVFLASDDQTISTTHLIQNISQRLHLKHYFIAVPFFEKVLKIINPSLHKKLYDDLIVHNTQSKEKLNYTNPYTTDEGIQKMLGDKK